MSDKRAMATDALETLGTIINDNCKRDAIHLAVEPCIAAHPLYPGQHIGIVNGKATIEAPKKLGIVDPFITGVVPEGEKFWLIVYPRQITSLRHVWEHPDFINIDKTKAESETWLREFCNTRNVSYDAIIAGVNGEPVEGYKYPSHIGDEYFVIKGEDAYGQIPPEFWDHIEVVTGKKMNLRPQYFSCSC